MGPPSSPSDSPSSSPFSSPSRSPTAGPSPGPSTNPNGGPLGRPSESPSPSPSSSPSRSPTAGPSPGPSTSPMWVLWADLRSLQAHRLLPVLRGPRQRGRHQVHLLAQCGSFGQLWVHEQPLRVSKLIALFQSFELPNSGAIDLPDFFFHHCIKQTFPLQKNKFSF